MKKPGLKLDRGQKMRSPLKYVLLSRQNMCMKGKAYFLLWRAGVGKVFL